MSDDRRKDDKNLRGLGRRVTDGRGGRPTRRAFRPLRWAWLLLLVALLAPAYDLFLPAGYHPPRERHTVVIEHGQSLHEIARELQRVGIIRSQAGFLVLARMMHLDRSVKAGQYSFKLGTTVPALLRALDRGMYGLNLVTIPEGLMVSETASLIQREVGISAAAIDSLARDPMLLDSLEVGAPSLEGWLAPDSYEWLPATSPEVVLRTMVARTRERVQHATAGYDSLPLGMNAHEVLTLASIVESESHAKEERPHIARVYLNRLDRGMLLQADPTVGYALGRGPRSRLTFKDLRVESPYNTYRHEGLPPGPICSPGQAAIEAVMNATPGAHDLYFVARGQGHHLFAPTYEQHLANIAFVRGKKAALAARENPDASSDAEPDADGSAGPPSPVAASVQPGPHVASKPSPLAPNGVIRDAANTPSPVALVVPPAAHSLHADSSRAAELHGGGLVKPAPAAPTHAAMDTVRSHVAKVVATAPVVPPASGAKHSVNDSAWKALALAGGAKPVDMSSKLTARDTTHKAATTGALSSGAAARAAARDTTAHKLAAKPAAHDSTRKVVTKSPSSDTTGAKAVAKPAARDTTRKASAGAAKAAGARAGTRSGSRSGTKPTAAKAKPDSAKVGKDQ